MKVNVKYIPTINLTVMDDRNKDASKDWNASVTTRSFTVTVEGFIGNHEVFEQFDAEYNKNDYKHNGEVVRDEAAQYAKNIAKEQLANFYDIDVKEFIDINELY